MSLRRRIENLEAGAIDGDGDGDGDGARPALVIYAPILDADGKPTGEYKLSPRGDAPQRQSLDSDRLPP